MAGKDGPKIVISVDTTQLDEAIAKVQKLLDMLYEVKAQKLLDMLYEADNLAPRILRSGEVNND